MKKKIKPELTENQTVCKSDNQGDKEETFIQTRGRGGDRQLRRGREDWEWGSEMADCGTGEARLQLADPTAPHSHVDKLGGTDGEQSRLSNPGLQCGEIKPQTSEWKHQWGLRQQQEKLPASQESSLERPTGAKSVYKPTHSGISTRGAQFDWG